MTPPIKKVLKVIEEFENNGTGDKEQSLRFYNLIKPIFKNLNKKTLVNNYDKSRQLIEQKGFILVSFWKLNQETERIQKELKEFHEARAKANQETPKIYKKSIINEILKQKPDDLNLEGLLYYIIAISGRRLIDVLNPWEMKDGSVYYTQGKQRIGRSEWTEFNESDLLSNTLSLEEFYNLIQRVKQLVETFLNKYKTEAKYDRLQQRVHRYSKGMKWYSISDLRDIYTLLMIRKAKTITQKLKAAQKHLGHKNVASTLHYTKNIIEDDTPAKSTDYKCEVCNVKISAKSKKRHENSKRHRANE